MRFGSPTNDAKVYIVFETAKYLERIFVKIFFSIRGIAIKTALLYAKRRKNA